MQPVQKAKQLPRMPAWAFRVVGRVLTGQYTQARQVPRTLNVAARFFSHPLPTSPLPPSRFLPFFLTRNKPIAESTRHCTTLLLIHRKSTPIVHVCVCLRLRMSWGGPRHRAHPRHLKARTRSDGRKKVFGTRQVPRVPLRPPSHAVDSTGQRGQRGVSGVPTGG